MADQLRDMGRTLRTLAGDADATAFTIVEGLADEWVSVARQRMGHDTGQLDARTGVRSISGGTSKATAVVQADTPYAGFHNYGNRYTPPNLFWNHGRDAAVRMVDQIGGRLETQLRRALNSGGVWSPRSLV